MQLNIFLIPPNEGLFKLPKNSKKQHHQSVFTETYLHYHKISGSEKRFNPHTYRLRVRDLVQ